MLAPSIAKAQTSKHARIIVSLADNSNQGIVPIKASLGNGQDLKGNLYWGALYGAKTHFKRMSGWTVKTRENKSENILDRFDLTHDDYPNRLISFEAWDGAAQKHSVKAYFSELKNTASQNELVGFVGHNALMDLFVANMPIQDHVKTANLEADRKGVVIACNSSSYFTPFHDAMGVESYVMTRGLMAPEAYVLEGLLSAWLEGQNANAARAGAAKQYAKYQKISIRAANRLFGVKT